MFHSLPLKVLITALCGQAGQPGTAHGSFPLEEARSKWTEYRTAARLFQGTYAQTTLVNGVRNRATQVTIRQNKDCAFQEVSGIIDNAQVNRLRGENTKYQFLLQKNDPTSQWFLGRLYHNSSDRDFINNIPMLALIFLEAEALDHLFKQPTLRVTSFDTVLQGQRGLKKLTILNPPRRPGVSQTGESSPVVAGWLILDPYNYWCLREADVRVEAPEASGQLRVKCDYDDTTHIPIPKRVESSRTLTATSDAKPYTVFRETVFHLRLQDEPPPDAEFYLSAFGLPEPQGIQVPTRPSMYHLWFLGFGIVSVLLMVYSRARKRKAIVYVPD